MPLDRLTKLDPLQLGRFTILARLGSGGMGNVYLAEADDGTPAAVKVIRADLARDPQFRARFRREVEAGRRAQNRCIARYLDADTYAAAPWLASEFVPGPTLHHDVHAHGPVTGPRVVGLGAGLADALVAIHGAGLVHRDLKPANILLAPDAPKVIDFGISLAADATVLTTTGTMVGSPAYMSPEQAKGIRDVGPAADVFSWACCMTFASRKNPPFGEGEAAGLLYKVVYEEPDLDGLAPALYQLVRASLDKDPANRPTALELVAGLTAVLDGVPVNALVAAPPEGGADRVQVPTSGANASRVLSATWVPDPVALEAAERTLSEAQELRAGLPPRAEERSRRDRARAKRAVFAAMLAGLIALLVVGVTAFRPGQEEEAKATDTGAGPDPDPSTTSSLVGSVAPAPSGAASTATSDPVAAAGGGAAVVGSTAAPGSSTPTTVASAPSTASAIPGTVSTAARVTCSTDVLNPPSGGAVNRLPLYSVADPRTYNLRIRVTGGIPGGELALVRQLTTGQQGRPVDAWAKPVDGGGSETIVGAFAMEAGVGPTAPRNGVVVHQEPSGATFDLLLRPSRGPILSCGLLRAGY